MILNVLYVVVLVLALPWVAWRKLSGGRPVAAPWTRVTGAIEGESMKIVRVTGTASAETRPNSQASPARRKRRNRAGRRSRYTRLPTVSRPTPRGSFSRTAASRSKTTWRVK